MLIEIGKADENLNVSYLRQFRPIFYRFDLFIFHSHCLGQYNIAQETNFVFIKSTLFLINIEAMFPQNIQHLPYGLYFTLARVFGIDEDIIQIHYDKDIELFCQDLIDITLEACWCIE